MKTDIRLMLEKRHSRYMNRDMDSRIILIADVYTEGEQQTWKVSIIREGGGERVNIGEVTVPTRTPEERAQEILDRAKLVTEAHSCDDTNCPFYDGASDEDL